MARVMVVEDDEGIRCLIQTVLQEGGHSIIPAANGQAALEALYHKPDLILLDLAMPIMDGRSFLRHYVHWTSKSVPIVVLTVHHEARLEPELASYIDGFIAKPFLPTDLLACVQGHVRQQAFH